MKKVFITRKIPQAAVDEIRKITSVKMSELRRDLTESELFTAAKTSEILVPTIANKITETFFSTCPSIKFIANYGVGVDHIDLLSAKKNNVLVSNTPDVLTETTANLIFSLILALTRRVVEGDRIVRKGDFHGIFPLFMLGVDIRDKILGIFGLGRIGAALAEKARFFGMNIIYASRTRNISAENKLAARFVTFDELLCESDILSVNTPLTPQTKGVFNLRTFSKMKRTAYFINAARGPIHIESDLSRALKKGLIAGAALDVYENEPLINRDLFKHENIILSPHIGSSSFEVRKKMGFIVAENIKAYIAGEEPPHLVKL